MNSAQSFVFVDCDTQRGMAEMCPGSESALPFIRRLVSLAADSRLPLISTVCAFAPDDKVHGETGGICVAGSPGAEKVEGTLLPGAVVISTQRGMDVPRPLPAQTVLEKLSFDPLSNPNALAVIEQIYGRTALLFGLSFERGVIAALRALRRFGLPCRVVRDAVTIDSPETAAQAEREVMEAGSRLVSTDAALSLVSQRSSSVSG
ncbi:MAG: isochorismatase family protein [Candidatus Sumerlaeia bacterium]|nr:isochorismatase family protein [Candidatus Sumerlaeia bacterium]